MADVLSSVVVKARKDYWCDASVVVNNFLGLSDLTDEEDAAAYRAAEIDGFKILEGQHYRRVAVKDGGEIYTFRARLAMDHLAEKHELYEE